jgi:hypothetical protein
VTQARPIGLAPGIPEAAAGQDAKKYASANPVVQRLIARLLATVRDLVGPSPGVLVDVGVGEGLALERLLEPGTAAVGIEYRLDKLRAATARIGALSGACGDAGMLPVRTGGADTVTCLEVLEHLTVVEPAVAELARITGGRCIVSVPWEPWFRLGNLGRGKNVRRLGNDAEHVQACSPSSLHRLLGGSFGHVEVHRSFPWLVAVASHARGPSPA